MMINNEKRRVLIIVPHQDDEINIAGGYIATFSKKGREIHVLFATNGDYIYDAETRIRECYRSCKKLGVKSGNTHFLGYSDQYSRYDTHLFNSSDIWTSRNGRSMTYAPSGIKEVSLEYTGKHHSYNRTNFISDIKLAIKKTNPETIISIDYDSHCDHRATSLGVEKAIGELIKEDSSFRPIVYKGFAYPTAYFGEGDYGSVNIKSTTFATEQYSYCDMENPYYAFDERIRFPLAKDCVRKLLFTNRVFKALKKHKSQIIIKKAFSIINGDQIYWQRRTDNLLYDATIKASSGDKEKLRDFLLFDSHDVLHGNMQKPVLEECAWKPTSKKPRIDIELKGEKVLDEIKLYRSIGCGGCISFKLLFDDKEYGSYEFIDGMVHTIKVYYEGPVRKVTMIFKNETSNSISISELEIFEKKEERIEHIIGLDNNDAMYVNVINNAFRFGIYGYNSYQARMLLPEECEYFVNGMETKYEDVVFERLPKKAKLLIRLKENNSVEYTCTIVKERKWHLVKNVIMKTINTIYLKLLILLFRVYRKIFIKKQKTVA